ncbi:MAG: cupin domain-containing protein [Candidatus Saccharibacteria bacterium]
MQGFNINIEQESRENDNFRSVIYTAKNSQLVLMSLRPNEEIGFETHPENDQFLRFETGKGKVLVNDATYEVENGSAVIVPAGAKHNVINTSENEALKLYTVYSPAHHKDGIIHATKADAEADESKKVDYFDGATTE